jgi:hypothetical protein
LNWSGNEKFAKETPLKNLTIAKEIISRNRVGIKPFSDMKWIFF